MSDQDSSIVSLEVPLALVVCIIYIFAGFSIEYYKKLYGHAPWIHESSISCLFGLAAGGLIKITTGQNMEFDGDLFFYLILPPIIFSAGYSLKRKKFFQYIHLILFFGLLGTFFNFFFVSCGTYIFSEYLTDLFPGPAVHFTWYECLLIASVLAGSDEVSAMSLVRISEFPRMGALIFGEGVINDAMSIVLFKTFLPLYYAQKSVVQAEDDEQLNVSTLSVVSTMFGQLTLAFIIGVSIGLLNARLMRVLDLEEHPMQQTSLVLLFGYLAYGIAEALGISGILTLFVAAIVLAHYSWYSLSKAAQVTTKVSSVAMSDIAEGFAFAYVGLSLWGYSRSEFNYPFAFYMIGVVLIARVLTIVGLFQLGGVFFNSFKVPLSEQIGFILGGIVRGCLCWAQVLQVGGNPVIVTSVLIIVMTTLTASGCIFPIVFPRLAPAKPSTTAVTTATTAAAGRKSSMRNSSLPPSLFSAASASEGEDAMESRPLLSVSDAESTTMKTRRVSYSSTVDNGAVALGSDLGPSVPEGGKEMGRGGESGHGSGRSCDRILPSSQQHPPAHSSSSGRAVRSASTASDRKRSSVVNFVDSIVIRWIQFDEQVMKPWFGGSSTAIHTKRGRLLSRLGESIMQSAASEELAARRESLRGANDSGDVLGTLSGTSTDILSADFGDSADSVRAARGGGEGRGGGLSVPPVTTTTPAGRNVRRVSYVVENDLDELEDAMEEQAMVEQYLDAADARRGHHHDEDDDYEDSQRHFHHLAVNISRRSILMLDEGAVWGITPTSPSGSPRGSAYVPAVGVLGAGQGAAGATVQSQTPSQERKGSIFDFFRSSGSTSSMKSAAAMTSSNVGSVEQGPGAQTAAGAVGGKDAYIHSNDGASHKPFSLDESDVESGASAGSRGVSGGGVRYGGKLSESRLPQVNSTSDTAHSSPSPSSSSSKLANIFGAIN